MPAAWTESGYYEPMKTRSQTWKDRIVHGSCEDLSMIPDGGIALTVTSPPYWNAIDYDRHADDNTQWYRTRQYTDARATYEEYLDWLVGIFCGVRRKTKPGGFCAVVIGTLLLNKKHYPIPFHLVHRMCEDGWLFHQDIIWNKVTGGVKRAGVFIQHPYPGYFHPNIMTEHILIFRRKGDPIFKDRTSREKESASVPINRLFTSDIANNVWHIAPVPPGHLDHPCPFPEEIPARLISLYSFPQDVVLDPFCGSGQTVKVAHHLNRHYVGFDVIDKYVKYSCKRLEEPLSIRQEQLIARFEKIPIDQDLQGSARPGTNRQRAAPANGDAHPLFTP